MSVVQLYPDPTALDMSRRLSNTLGDGYTVILFGSRQRGDHRPDSDVDLMIHCDDDSEERFNCAFTMARKFTSENPERASAGLPIWDLNVVAGWGEPLESADWDVTVFHYRSDDPPSDLPVRLLTGATAETPGCLITDAVMIVKSDGVSWGELRCRG